MSPRLPAPAHPSQLLPQRMRAVRISANKLAADIATPTNWITLILSGRRGITPDTAVRLGRWFGIDPMELLIEQARYDIYVTTKALKRKLATMPTLKERTT